MGNVRAYRPVLTISGKVAHNVTAAGEVFELEQGGTLAGVSCLREGS